MNHAYQRINSSSSSSNINNDEKFKKKIMITILVIVFSILLTGFLVNSAYNCVQYASRLYLLLTNQCINSLLGDWCSTFIDIGYGIITLITENTISVEYEYENNIKSCILNTYINNLKAGENIPVYLLTGKDDICEHDYYVSEYYDANYESAYNEYTMKFATSFIIMIIMLLLINNTFQYAKDVLYNC